MKKTTILRWAPSRAQTRILILLLLCGAIGLSAQAPTTSIPPSPGLAVFDPTPVVAAFGQSSTWNAWADKAITTLGQQTQANTAAEAADAANIATLQSQISSLAQPSSTILVTSAQLSASTPAVRLDYASCVPTTPVVGWITAGETNDFTFNVPTAGNYLITACEASSGAATYHFEFPVGTKVGASLTATNTGAWHTFALQSATAPVALPSGSVTVRVVFESAGMNLGNLSFTRQ